jgi:hypothetical protein
VAKQAFEKKLAALEALRHASDPATVRDALRKALKERNNYLVSKAAAIVGDLRIEDLMDDLIAAFDRFFADPVKSDPQCWAKNAIAKALKGLGCRQASVFRRGVDHRATRACLGRKRRFRRHASWRLHARSSRLPNGRSRNSDSFRRSSCR